MRPAKSAIEHMVTDVGYAQLQMPPSSPDDPMEEAIAAAAVLGRALARMDNALDKLRGTNR
jgi:hypothetical protein